jgi:hypothetical protein
MNLSKPAVIGNRRQGCKRRDNLTPRVAGFAGYRHSAGQLTAVRMRRCPACRRRLGMSFIFEMKHITRFLCTRCWATIHLGPVEFATYTVAGGVLGIIAIAGIALAGHSRLPDLGGAWGFIVCPAALAGRFLPKLVVEDPPLA